MGELLKAFGKGSCLENLRMYRTKCTKLILNVISPSIVEQLVSDVGNKGYSLIVDESTDVSVSKYMAYCIRYHSESLNRITVEFLGLAIVERATADALRDITIEFLNELKLKPENIIGIGVDGASNLCGQNHSLYTLLREISPNIQLIKCICHSLNTCSFKASEQIPTHIEFLLRESVSWFSHSPLRQMEYSTLYKTINGDGSKQKKLKKLCATRWLAFYNCISIILDQWLELKTCFGMAAVKEKCHSVQILSNMYKDDSNLLYLTFLKPILREVTNVNLLFQSDHADLTKVYGDLKSLLVAISKRIIKPNFLCDDEVPTALCVEDVDRVAKALKNKLALLPLDSVDFGYAFSILANEKTIASKDLQIVKSNCANFIVSLCEQLVNRLPNNVKIINQLKHFNPRTICSAEPPAFKDLPLELASNSLINN